jgi:hypothetical protein
MRAPGTFKAFFKENHLMYNKFSKTALLGRQATPQEAKAF